MAAFEVLIKSTFVVSKMAHSSVSLMGCDITRRDRGAITTSKRAELSDLDSQILRDAVGGKGDCPATERKATLFRSLIGKMLLIGRMSASVMLMHASMATSKNFDLK